MINGKPLADWMTGLKDRDPAVRLRAVEALGRVTRDQAGGSWPKLQITMRSVGLDDKDPAVRKAASFFAELMSGKLSNAPEIRKRMLEDRERTVAPILTPVRLVDGQARPVNGCSRRATIFRRDSDLEPSFTAPESIEVKTSDEEGDLALKLDIPGHLDGVGVFAIRAGQRSSAGGAFQRQPRADRQADHDRDASGLPHPPSDREHGPARLGKEVQRPANRSGAGGERPTWVLVAAQRLRAALCQLDEPASRVPAPPGQFTIRPYGSDVKGAEYTVDIKPDERELFLGTIDLSPDDGALQGRFPDHHRVRLNRGGDGDDQKFALRRVIERWPSRSDPRRA